MADTQLLPMGDLDCFITDKRSMGNTDLFDGCDVNAVILDVRITEDADGNGLFHLLNQQRTPNFTSWNRGNFSTQVSVFVNVLAAEGDTSLHLFDTRGAGVRIDGTNKNKGWKHYFNYRKGFGEEEKSAFVGKGRLKVAICLPYVGHGFHGGTPVWAGYMSEWYAQDTRALTTGLRK